MIFFKNIAPSGHHRFAILTLGWLLTAWLLSTYRTARVCKVFQRAAEDRHQKVYEEARKKKQAERSLKSGDQEDSNDIEGQTPRERSCCTLETVLTRSSKLSSSKPFYYASLIADYLFKFPAMSLFGPAW